MEAVAIIVCMLVCTWVLSGTLKDIRLLEEVVEEEDVYDDSWVILEELSKGNIFSHQEIMWEVTKIRDDDIECLCLEYDLIEYMDPKLVVTL